MRVVSQASGNEITSAASVTATASTTVSINTVRVRSDVAISQVSVHPSSHTRTTRYPSGIAALTPTSNAKILTTGRSGTRSRA